MRKIQISRINWTLNLSSGLDTQAFYKNIARVRNCPDVTILNCLLGLCQLSFCLFVFSSLCLVLYFCLFCLGVRILNVPHDGRDWEWNDGPTSWLIFSWVSWLFSGISFLVVLRIHVNHPALPFGLACRGWRRRRSLAWGAFEGKSDQAH